MGDHQNPIILKDAAGVLSVSAESDMWTVQEGWRYMFGSEAFPAALFGMLLFFVPKTPPLFGSCTAGRKGLLYFREKSMVRIKLRKFLMILRLLHRKKQKNSLLME